ncbi:MAG TPA: hypothetical protein PKZ32_18900 [Candidatus Melainabacteria bacterium]|nr:hypothetical protein [Candidatus Melainabacteria bacterium]
MRLLLWGLAAVALLATEPGKRLQKKAVCAFKELKGKACGAKSDSEVEEAKTGEGKDGNQAKDENGKRKLRAVKNDEGSKSESNNRESENDQAELEDSRVAMKDSNERRPEMGAEENEEQEEPRIFDEAGEQEEDQSDEQADQTDEEETVENDSSSEESIENSGQGLDQKKAEELVEKLNTKPSAPEGELKSA